jgi:Glycosyl transferase family 8
MSTNRFCTIVTRSHLKYAVALAKSLRRYHPAHKLCVLVIDSVNDQQVSDSSVDLFSLGEIHVPKIEDMTIYFDAFELSNCLKPFFIAHLLRKGVDKTVYLDADILVVNDFDILFDMLDQYHFVLTPHWLKPELVQHSDVSVRQISDLGIYNGGMWGVRNAHGGMAVLEWLMRFLPEVGFKDPHNGMFVDQKILPLVAQLFSSEFGCMRHPGYNVAYWNFHERDITKVNNRYLINGQPAIFFHLSGFNAEAPDIFSRWSSWDFDRLPILKDIIAEYLSYIPPEMTLKRSDYLYDYIGSYRLSSDLRRYYFVHRTLAGYRSARFKDKMRRWGRRLLPLNALDFR